MAVSTGLSLGDFAIALTAIAALLGGLLTWSTAQVNANSKTNEGRVADMRDALVKSAKEADERIDDLRSEMMRQRDDWNTQMMDVRATLTEQARTIRRQETQLGDYARHVGKLERIMSAAQLEIPPFETSQLVGGAA